MERFQYNKLIEWYESKRRKPLLILGARQVGKSYLIKEMFAKTYLKNYVYIDLKRDDSARDFFSTTSSPEKYLKFIEAEYGKKISNECPLIIDEAQLCHNVISSMKYFCQDYQNLPIIVSGSMVRISLKVENAKEDDLYPVGKIQKMYMYPLTFDEYLLNTNKLLLEKITKSYLNKKPLEYYEHEIALDYLYDFLSIGGMPEVVDSFIRNKSYIEVNEILDEIYDGYISDMDLYNVSSETIIKTKKIYNNIFFELNKENKNFKISLIDKNKSNRDYRNAYDWLEMANVIYKSHHLSGRVMTPMMEDEAGLFRIYLADEGMFLYQSKEKQTSFFVKEKRNALSGIFFESYVADELKARGIPLYYWTGKNDHEFEFIVENYGKIIPIYVKKKTGKLNSLDEFRTINGNSLAIKISSNNFGYDKDKNILTIPLYMTFMLLYDIKNGISIEESLKSVMLKQ